MASNLNILSIPLDSDRDILFCGRCKIMFYVLSDFMEHKLTDCGEIRENGGKVREDPLSFESSELEKKDCDGKYEVVSESSSWEVVSTRTDSVKLGIQEKSEKLDKVANFETFRCSKKEKFKCPVDLCEYSSFLMKDLKRHVRRHTGERPFKCMLCPKMFTRKDKFKVHLRIHKGEKKYKCPDCDYAAVESNSLLRHSRIHTGHKPFKCQLCAYCARDKSQLTVHLRMHTGDSPYVCAHEKCKAAFKTSTGLKRHASVHSPKNPHFCSHCSFKSDLKVELISHVRKKHPNEEDAKTHDCPHCVDRFFASKAKFQTHLRVKHGILIRKATPVRQKRRIVGEQGGAALKRDYECRQCDASFVCAGSLRTHERQHDKKNNTCDTGSNEKTVNPADAFLAYAENPQLDVNLKMQGSLYYTSPDESIQLIEANFL